MTRTTIDIDSSVLRQVRRIARESGKSLSRVVSELIVAALGSREEPRPSRFRWRSAPMRARADLEDKEAIRRLLDAE
jgi:hypothetical protein